MPYCYIVFVVVDDVAVIAILYIVDVDGVAVNAILLHCCCC